MTELGANVRQEAEVRTNPGVLRAMLLALRPRQWVKNMLLFAGLLFSGRLTDLRSVAIATAAFAVFTGLSGAGYLVNDVLDSKRDRTHPRKALRPVASGLVSKSQALWLSGALTVLSLGVAAAIDFSFLAFAAGYVALTVSYSAVLKHVFLVDVISLSAFYVLRAAGGAAAIEVAASPWLLTCTLLLALFLGLCKRRRELITLGAAAAPHRSVLRSYSVAMLDQMIATVLTTTLVAYVLYVLLSEHGRRNELTVLTIPFVIYGLFRYLYLARRGRESGAPEETLLRDRPLLLCVVLWVIAVGLVLYLPVA